MLRPILFTAFVMVGSAAQAGDKPLYAPAPVWVKPAPPIDAAKLATDAPIFLVMDSQQRLQDGEVASYSEQAARMTSPQMLDAFGTVKLPWQPDKGDLTIHTAEIIRGAEHINLLKGGDRFSVLRREEQLEQRMMNGLLTATMAVEGLRVGDVLHLAYSQTQKDATLQGNVQAFAQLPADPVRAAFGRVRLLWPQGQDVRWKMSATAPAPQVTTIGGYRDLTLTVPLAKQPEMPSDAPPRFGRPPLIEATTFTDWAGISRIMAPLYATKGLIAPGSPLAGEVAKIAAAEQDPVKRAALALQLVQDKVRYLFKGMDNGNYVPQTPTQTWTVRYGDCKAKTLLLLAILTDLGIEAEPVLASSQLGDWVPERLPSPGAFDHVFVRATIAGESLWLDGTGSGSLLADIRDTPPFRNVLPLRAAGADVMPLPMRASARPEISADLQRDESAGVNFPAPFTLSVTMRGQVAQMLRGVQGQIGKEQLSTMATQIATPFVGSDATIVSRELRFDDGAGTVTVTANGVAYPGWDRENERYRTTMDPGLSDLSFDPDRNRAAWRDIPVSTGNADNYVMRMRVRLPDGGKGFALEGSPKMAETLVGKRIERSTTLANGYVTSDIVQISSGAEIPVTEIGVARQKLAQAKQHMLRVVAPEGYPAEWQTVQAGRQAKAFEPILALYKQGVADRPDKAEPFTNRAWFYERIYDRKAAIEDIGRAIAIEPTVGSHLWRARLYRTLGDKPKALADILAARQIDPGSTEAIEQLATLYSDTGDKDKALALFDERIDEGGKDKADFMRSKAELLGSLGDKEYAIKTINAAIAETPGNPELLNSRCWLKGTMNTMLDTALKDCTKAIALSDSAEKVLDSRAMVYFRMNQFDDALADLNAALEQSPGLAASLYMRGVIHKRQGDGKAAEVDLAAARMIAPLIDERYQRYGITP
jgi:tetratricopeptide (TPR) repeat protein